MPGMHAPLGRAFLFPSTCFLEHCAQSEVSTEARLTDTLPTDAIRASGPTPPRMLLRTIWPPSHWPPAWGCHAGDKTFTTHQTAQEHMTALNLSGKIYACASCDRISTAKSPLISTCELSVMRKYRSPVKPVPYIHHPRPCRAAYEQSWVTGESFLVSNVTRSMDPKPQWRPLANLSVVPLLQ